MHAGKILRWGLFLYIVGGTVFSMWYWRPLPSYQPWMLFHPLVFLWGLVMLFYETLAYGLEYWVISIPLLLFYVTVCIKYKAFSTRCVQYIWLAVLEATILFFFLAHTPSAPTRNMGTNFIILKIRDNISRQPITLYLIMALSSIPVCILLTRVCTFLADRINFEFLHSSITFFQLKEQKYIEENPSGKNGETGRLLRWIFVLFLVGGNILCAAFWGNYVSYSMFQVPWLLKLFFFYLLMVATYTMEWWWLSFPLYTAYLTYCLKYKAFNTRFVQYFWLLLLLDIVVWIIAFIVPFGQTKDYVMGRIAIGVHYSTYEFIYVLLMLGSVFPLCIALAKLCGYLAGTGVFTGAQNQPVAKFTPQQSEDVYAKKEIIEKALKWDAENISLLRTLGKLYYKEGRLTDAVKTYERMTGLKDACLPDYKFLCMMYRQAEKFDEQACAVFEYVCRQEPGNAECMIYLAKCYFVNGKLQEAFDVMSKADTSTMPFAMEIKADILYSRGDYNGAREILSQLLTSNPDENSILFKYAKVQMKKDEIDSAIVCFQKCAREKEREFESTKYLGECFLRKELLDIAVRRFIKALELHQHPDEEKEVNYNLGLCYEKKGDAAKAKEHYKKVVLADFNFKDVKARFEKCAKPDKMWMDEALTGEIDVDINEQAKMRYKILLEIGRGGMGIVYKSVDTYLDRTIALKVLHDDLNASPAAVKRFITEAKAAAALNHPHIINIYDVGEEKGRKFISMEYIDSGSLREKIEKGINDNEIEKVLKQVCSALLFAHSKGIIHRDIKPDNVLLTKEGIAKITDFGIAKIHAESREIFKTSSIVGTPLYISPEQINGEEADARSDIYSLGALLYEMLSGKPPFTRGDIYYQHLNIEPQDPSLIRENVPEHLKNIALKCLQKKKEERYSSVDSILKQIAD